MKLVTGMLFMIDGILYRYIEGRFAYSYRRKKVVTIPKGRRKPAGLMTIDSSSTFNGLVVGSTFIYKLEHWLNIS